MRRGLGLVWVLAAAVLACPAYLRIARADEAAATARAILEPELPPEIDQSPPAITRSPSRAEAVKVKPAPSVAVEPSPLEKSDPEVGTPPLPAGAAPGDVADALEALPPSEGKRSPITALPNWRAAREALVTFYAGRADLAIWTNATGFNLNGRAVIARLKRAGEDGLDIAGLVVPEPNATIKDPALLAKAEISLSEAIVAYAFQAGGGRIDPARISPFISARAQVVDPVRALSRVATASDPDAALADFNPPQKGYRDLRDELAQLRVSLGDSRSRANPLSARPRQGVNDSRGLIRPRFELAGAEAGAQIAAADLARPGDAPTASRYAVPAEDGASRALEATILANMEMWRWEPRDMGEERIEVNIADFTLRVLRGDETLLSARIIVGKPDTQTPIFSNAMRYILVNPSWSVPPSIIRKEMLPKLADDPDYLTREGFEVTQRGDSIEVRQPPGERNALGRVAFMFPNEHSIYLHDTPARALFTASRRAFSHGCVRVDQPMRLAQLVMGGAWSEQRLRALIGGAERTIFLPRPMPIHIEYFTAFVDDAGALQTREDVYGHTRRVESALGVPSRS